MRKEKLVRQTISILTALVLVLSFISLWPETSPAAVGKDYVIVIDISTSMQDIFEEVKQVSKRTISKAQVGDNVAVITFGEQAILLDRKQIRGKADLEVLKKQVDDLYPTDYATYINRGLEKGLSELRYLFEKYPDRERILLWLSDDKDNPPEALGDEIITLEKLRNENRDFEPSKEWFTYDAPLSEVKNDNLIDFVTWARRTTFRVAVKEDDISLGDFEDGAVEKKVVLTFEPRHPGAAGLEFSAGARVVNPEDPTRSIPVTLSPKRIVASKTPWQQEFKIAFKGKPGEHKGFLSFVPAAGTPLDVEPRTIVFTAMIVPPKLAEPEPGPAVEEPKPTGLLASAKERGIIATEDRPPGLTRPDKPLDFGPLVPGKKISKIITLHLDKEADPKGITHDASIDLPDGVAIESKVFGKGTKLAAEIAVLVDKDIQLPETFSLQQVYQGSIRFKSAEPNVQVLPVYTPISVTFSTERGVRWGRKMLPQAEVAVERAKARRMTFEELTKEMEKGGEAEEEPTGFGALRRAYSRASSRYVLFAVLGAVVIVLGFLLYRMRPASQMFVGELVVIKDPSDSNMKNVNLKRIGSFQNKSVLTLGNSPKAEIRLNHESVSPIHCKISAKTTENQTEVAVHPMKGHPIKINDIEQSEKTALSDKDLVGIGDFILLFSNPEVQKEIVTHFLDGTTMRGTPVTWDIGAPSFELLRTEPGGAEETAEEIATVKFADLKAVFFLQEDSGAKEGIPKERISTEEVLEVTFSDGEKIEGRPLTDYSDISDRFYIVPEEMPNIVSILVERAGVKEVARRKAPSEPEKARPGGLFAFLRR